MQQSIAHIALVVRDYDEAISFFTEELHFTLVEDIYQPEQDKRWVTVAPPEMVVVAPVDKVNTPSIVVLVAKWMRGSWRATKIGSFG